MKQNAKLVISGFLVGFGIGVLAIGIADNEMTLEIDRLQKRCYMLQNQRDYFVKVIQTKHKIEGTNYTVVPVKGVN